MFLKVMKFFSLLDRSNNLSLTNLAVFVIIVRIAMAPLDWVTAAGLLVTLLNYGHKRITSNKAETK